MSTAQQQPAPIAGRPPVLPTQTAPPVRPPTTAQPPQQPAQSSVLRQGQLQAQQQLAEQRVAGKLAARPPTLPEDPSGATEPLTRFERLRWQLLLKAQNNLADSAAWAREILSPAPTTAVPSTEEVSSTLKQWQTRGEAAIAAQSKAHAREIHALQAGAALFAEDLTSLKRAGISGSVERVQEAKRARQAASPSVKIVDASAGALTAASQQESTSGPARPTSGGIVSL